MRLSARVAVWTLALAASSCGSSSPADPGSTPLASDVVRESVPGTISATGAVACSMAFQRSVDASYYAGGTQRCVEFTYTTTLGGPVSARLTWDDPRLDLDLVLNDTVSGNYQQSIAANRCCETVQTVLRSGAKYAFVVYLRGVDAQFLANGGTFSGTVSTPFTLAVERTK
jgi:hypothetical protein